MTDEKKSKRMQVVGTKKPNVFSSEGRIRYGETVEISEADANLLLDEQYVAKPGTKAAEKAIFEEANPQHKSQK